MEGTVLVGLGLRFLRDQSLGIHHFAFEILKESAGIAPTMFEKGDKNHGENQEQGDPE